MLFDRMIHTVDSHTEGNPTRIIVSGFGNVPGSSVAEKREYVMKHMDGLRRMLLHEPRGGGLNCAVLPLPPCDPAADVCAIIMEQDEYVPMCGHCIIGLATTLVEMNLVERTTPRTTVVIETLAGLVTAEVDTSGQRVGAVTLRNVPSFLAHRDVELTLSDGRSVIADVVFGGDFYVCVPADQLGLTLAPSSAADIVRQANLVREAAAGFPVVHPGRPDLSRAYMVMFYREDGADPTKYRNVVIAPPGAIDRSPCGTGTSALLARLVARGLLQPDEVLTNHGIVGTAFRARVAEQTTVGTLPAVVPEITGRAYLTGFHQWVIDPEDPFPAGFLLG